MVYSMTGYGKGSVTTDREKITTEIRTVNHRFLDIKLNVPHSLLKLEDEIRRLIQSFFTRGRVEVNIHIESENESLFKVLVDWNLMDQYVEQINKVKKRYNLQGEIPLELITSLPDLFLLDQCPKLIEETKEQVLASVDQACEEVKLGRHREGEKLKDDIEKRVQAIHDIVTTLEQSQSKVVSLYQERIKERIQTYINDSAIVDKIRLHQEIALLVDKGDITEEITRLKSHLLHSTELINEQKPIGRKLDFVVQEIHRELNTIGSKAIDEQTGRLIIHAKSELEKVREQIQNIE